MEKFNTGIFDRLSEKKKTRILDLAVREIAEKGFINSRIKDIAQKAGISYGSMYSYFPKKDDLLRTIITRNIAFQKNALDEIINEDENIFTNIENYFHLVLKTAEENPGLIAIWRDIAQSYHTNLLPEIMELEKEGLKTIKKLISRAIEKGVLLPDINIEASVYVIDCISSEMLASFVSEQNMKKRALFFGGKTNREIVDDLMIIVRKILLSSSSSTRKMVP